MTAVLMIAAAACFGGFSWAIARLFVRSGPMPGPMKVLGVIGLGCFGLQEVALGMAGAAMPSSVLALLLYLASASLFWWAAPYARAGQLGLAFDNKQAARLVTEGPYRWLRHPFYAAYMIFWLAGVVGARDAWLLITLCATTPFYLSAIHAEEKQISASPLGEAYRAYAKTAGMLWPRRAKLPDRG